MGDQRVNPFGEFLQAKSYHVPPHTYPGAAGQAPPLSASFLDREINDLILRKNHQPPTPCSRPAHGAPKTQRSAPRVSQPFGAFHLETQGYPHAKYATPVPRQALPSPPGLRPRPRPGEKPVIEPPLPTRHYNTITAPPASGPLTSLRPPTLGRQTMRKNVETYALETIVLRRLYHLVTHHVNSAAAYELIEKLEVAQVPTWLIQQHFGNDFVTPDDLRLLVEPPITPPLSESDLTPASAAPRRASPQRHPSHPSHPSHRRPPSPPPSGEHDPDAPPPRLVRPRTAGPRRHPQPAPAAAAGAGVATIEPRPPAPHPRSSPHRHPPPGLSAASPAAPLSRRPPRASAAPGPGSSGPSGGRGAGSTPPTAAAAAAAAARSRTLVCVARPAPVKSTPFEVLKAVAVGERVAKAPRRMTQNCVSQVLLDKYLAQ